MKIRRQFLLTLLTFGVLALAAGIAIFVAKGYRYSPKERVVFGTGILSLTSTPDQASVYLDGHLTTATNANINSLEPKKYRVRIIKEGHIPWEKDVDVQQGLVTEVKATLFPAIPSIYPLTYNGVKVVTISPDSQRLAFVVTLENEDTTSVLGRKSGVWVWDMSERPVAFTKGREPHQILPGVGYDLSKAKLRWSPDSSQVLVDLGDRNLLLDANKPNDNPRDITPVLKVTINAWDEDTKASNLARLQTLQDKELQKTASASALVKWSVDETKILYSQDGKTKYKVADLLEKKTYDLPEARNYSWLADSRHLVLVESDLNSSPTASPVAAQKDVTTGAIADNPLTSGRISIVEFDGKNKSVLYAGKFDPDSVSSWPDSSRVVIVSSIPTPTADKPNLFGINLK